VPNGKVPVLRTTDSVVPRPGVVGKKGDPQFRHRGNHRIVTPKQSKNPRVVQVDEDQNKMRS
jgi:hypothetical protein